MAAQLFNTTALTLFFEDANNMGLSHCTRLQLAVEGITEPEDFKEFNNNGMKAIFTNLLKPPKVPALSGLLVLLGPYERSRHMKCNKV
jgi:hypothetical protein